MLVIACARNETQTSDPIVLGMLPGDPPRYDDGETTIYQVSLPVSLPVTQPSPAERAALASTAPAPFTRAPWITTHDVRVQVAWTISNLDGEPHNVELLVDPWNEFARYVPGVNIGEEEIIPDLSGVQLLMRVDGLSRRSGTLTFDDMDELANDLATTQNILATAPANASLNGMINHAFDLQNRTGDGDKLLSGYTPAVVPGLVGFDLGLRTYAPGTLAIEIVVEVLDAAGNRTIDDAPIRSDGTLWITPEATVSAPMADVR